MSLYAQTMLKNHLKRQQRPHIPPKILRTVHTGLSPVCWRSSTPPIKKMGKQIHFSSFKSLNNYDFTILCSQQRPVVHPSSCRSSAPFSFSLECRCTNLGWIPPNCIQSSEDTWVHYSSCSSSPLAGTSSRWHSASPCKWNYFLRVSIHKYSVSLLNKLVMLLF